MIVRNLRAQNFRNLTNIDFFPSDSVNVLFGDNAQGKTNLIEALWLFTGSRSFRGSRDIEFLKFGEYITSISAEFSSRGLENSASIKISKDVKAADFNGIRLPNVSALAGRFCAVVFSPDHLELVKAGPQQRRKFIDCAITEIWPRHTAALSEYKNLLKQRNALLKDISSHSELIDTLPVWDAKIAAAGASIVFTRLRYLSHLTEKAALIYGGIASNPKEELILSYESSGNSVPEDISNSREAQKHIRECLETSLLIKRSEDIDSGITTIGPHRDDIKISIGGVDSRLYSSQGQQRSAVLSLKLAEAAVLKETIGEPPVLLLDDVMSELDRSRQNYILNNIGGFQVFITCCDPSSLEGLCGGSAFEVKKGEILKKI